MIAAAASCGVLLGAASVWSLCGVWQRFFCSARGFLASAVTNAALVLLLMLYWHSFASFFGLQSPSAAL